MTKREVIQQILVELESLREELQVLPMLRRPPKKIIINTVSIEPRERATEKDCPICFEEKKIKLMCSTNCHHMFCKVCIAKHFNKNSDKCPMCREQIKMLRNIV
jgi:hypothetical protein